MIHFILNHKLVIFVMNLHPTGDLNVKVVKFMVLASVFRLGVMVIFCGHIQMLLHQRN